MADSGGEADRRRSGDGDALLVNDQRAELVRIAYGRAETPSDQARAAEAQRRLAELDAREVEARDAEERARRGAADARERRRHRVRSRVVSVGGATAILGVLAAVGVMLLTPAAPGNDLPRFIPPTSTSPVDLGRGTIATVPTGAAGRVTSGSAASAEHWFDDPQKPSDVIAQPPTDIDPASTRAVDSSVEGWQVFIAKGTQGGFCVIASEAASGASTTGCAARDQFTSAGILLSGTGTTSIVVYWDGFDLKTEPSVSYFSG